MDEKDFMASEHPDIPAVIAAAVEIPSQVSFAQADREKLAVCMAGGVFHREMFIDFIFQGNSLFSSNHNTLLFKQGFSHSPAKKCIC